jgi:hypothetical protein
MGCASSVDIRGEEEEERDNSGFTKRKKNSMVDWIKRGHRAEDERQGFRKAKAKKRFSVVDFVKSNVRGRRQAEDERYAGLKENRKPAESSAKKRFSVVDFVKNNVRGKRFSVVDFVKNIRGKRQAESSSSETTARCTLCAKRDQYSKVQSADKHERKTCVLCGSAPHHARGRERSISLDGYTFTRAPESTSFPASSTEAKGSSQTIFSGFEFDDKVPQTSSPIRHCAFKGHRRSMSADYIPLTSSIGKLPSTTAPFCTRPLTLSRTCSQHRPSDISVPVVCSE